MSDKDYTIETLARGFRILELFTVETPNLTLTEIARQAGLSKSTSLRIASTLVSLGYLERDPQTKRYRPGMKVLRLGFVVLNSLELAEIAKPFMAELSAKCGETTNVTIRDGASITYVARSKTTQIVGVNLTLGSQLPVYCTSMGKATLIDLSREELRDLLGEGPYPKRGPNTLTTLEALAAELEKVRRQGYAVNDEELTAGLRSVAAPITGPDGKAFAAVNISVPGARVLRKELEERLAPMVVEAARQISQALGSRIKRNAD